MRSLIAALALLALAPSARADEPTPATPLVTVKEVKATSVGVHDEKPAHPRRAFDGYDLPGTYTNWCTKDGHAKGQSVTLVLTQARAVDHVQIAADKTVKAMTVITDQGKFPVQWDARGVPFAKPTGSTAKITVELTEVDESKGSAACISDVSLSEANQTLIFLHGVPASAAARLAPALASAGKAMKACDPAALAKVAAFPVAYDHVGGTDATEKAKLANAAALARVCKNRGFGKVDAESEPISYADVGTVAVRADEYRWVMAWKGGQWKLVSVEGTGPVRH